MGAGSSARCHAVGDAHICFLILIIADECKPYPIPGKYKGLQHMCSEMFKHDSGK